MIQAKAQAKNMEGKWQETAQYLSFSSSDSPDFSSAVLMILVEIGSWARDKREGGTCDTNVFRCPLRACTASPQIRKCTEK